MYSCHFISEREPRSSCSKTLESRQVLLVKWFYHQATVASKDPSPFINSDRYICAAYTELCIVVAGGSSRWGCFLGTNKRQDRKINTFRLGQNDRQFADGILKCMLLNAIFFTWFQFHWSLFLRVLLPTLVVTELSTSHFLHKWWHNSLTHICFSFIVIIGWYTPETHLLAYSIIMP